MSLPIYLDYQATTPVDSRVASVILNHLTSTFGNAGSVDHVFGDRADQSVRTARSEVGKLLDVPVNRIVFTSGATESINLAIRGLADRMSPASRLKVLTSPTEHNAVLDCCAASARRGSSETSFLRVDRFGAIDLSELESKLGAVDLVCLMAANNEIGTVHPIEAIADICQAAGKPFLCDATQIVGKELIDFGKVSLVAFSGHKLYGPKGCGVLIVGDELMLEPQIYGGGQQRGVRSGTLNVPGIAGLGEACRLRRLEMSDDEARIRDLRDEMLQLLRDQLPQLVLNGDPDKRIAGNLHFSLPDRSNDMVIARLRNTIAISTGAACSSGSDAPSHVLQAIGLPISLQEGAFRIGLGKFTSRDDITQAAELFVAAVQETGRALLRLQSVPALGPVRLESQV